MKKTLLLTFCIAFAGIASAQYISEVFDYRPGPGQWINVEPWGTPDAMTSLVGGVNGTMSLGSYGGYVVFGFENPVQNDPDNPYGIDFTIFGNPYDDWSEPGIVYVMQDENHNGLPDDQWYQIAGSDYYFSHSYQKYVVTYSNPGGDVAANVPWTDNRGNSGVVEINQWHNQPYYPLETVFSSIPASDYSLSGSYVKAKVDATISTMVKSFQRAFGYADNVKRGMGDHTIPDNPYTSEVENSGADGIDISWAVNDDGNYVDLTYIDFVMVQSAALDNAGWLGEVSTEVCGAVDVAPDNSISGQNEILVVADLPVICTSPTWQLEYVQFEDGRRIPNTDVSWNVDMSGAYVDENEILHIPNSGEFILTATSVSNPELTWSQSCVAELSTGVSDWDAENAISIYPVPASDQLNIKVSDAGSVMVVDAKGEKIWQNYFEAGTHIIDLSEFSNGLYMIVLNGATTRYTRKFIVSK